jgi:hypothetical protein
MVPPYRNFLMIQQADEKRPSASFPSSFVVAEVQKTFGRSYDRIYRRSGPRFYTPQDFGRLAFGHF